MRDFIDKRIREIQRKRKKVGEGKGLGKAASLIGGLGLAIAGALSVVATPLVGIGAIALGASCLYNFKTMLDKDNSERKSLEVQENHLNTVRNNGGVRNDATITQQRKDRVKVLKDDLTDATEDLERTNKTKKTVGTLLAISAIPLYAWAGPVTLAVTIGLGLSKLWLDKQSKDEKEALDRIQTEMDVINDDIGVASKMTPPQQPQQTQGQQQQNGRGNTRSNTRQRQQQQGQQQQTQQQTNTQQQRQPQQTQQQAQQQQTQTQQQRPLPQRRQTTQGQQRQQTTRQQQPVVTPNPTRQQQTRTQQGNSANVNAVNNFVNGLNGVDEFDMLRNEYQIRLNALADNTNRVLNNLFITYQASAGSMSQADYDALVDSIKRQYNANTIALRNEYYQKVRQLAQQMGIQYRII